MAATSWKPAWHWRLLGLAVVLVPLALLLWLAGRVPRLQAQAMEKVTSQLAQKLAQLPRPESDELRGAMLCLSLRQQGFAANPRALGGFFQAARMALADDRLTPAEAAQLAVLARQACQGQKP